MSRVATAPYRGSLIRVYMEMIQHYRHYNANREPLYGNINIYTPLENEMAHKTYMS